MNAKVDALASARRTLKLEAEAILQLAQKLDQTFTEVCHCILESTGRVVLTGMGKSGYIAQKIASSLSSTGTAAFFLHPGEAAHGDLGGVRSEDVVIAISNSGNSDELTTILPGIKQTCHKLIGMTSSLESPLAKMSDIVIPLHITEEACPLGLAPTVSTTTALACGDALVVALMEAREIDSEQYARNHPAGQLGRRLLYRVRDIMQTASLPLLNAQTLLRDALVTISQCGFGFGILCQDNGALYGVFSDGDLRRALKDSEKALKKPIGDLCTRKPLTITPDYLARDAVLVMQKHSIYTLVVVEDDKPVGLINMHELIRRGIA